MLIEMANIRNQLAWVHSSEPEAATAKARDLVRMAVSKAALLEPIPPVSVRITPQVLVIGGGLAGMVSALTLAERVFPSICRKIRSTRRKCRRLFRKLSGMNPFRLISTSLPPR